MKMSFKANYCVYCGNLSDTDKPICKDCWFLEKKSVKNRKFCIACGERLNRKGYACKHCYYEAHKNLRSQDYLENKDKLVLNREIRNERKNPSCVYSISGMCRNKNLNFQGHKFRCDMCPRTSCPHFKSARPEVLEFIRKLDKLKGGNKQNVEQKEKV